MNLGEMCQMAARYSDRYDEYEKTEQADGTSAFEGEALHWFNLFRDAVNEAYFDISRSRATPQKQVLTTVPEGGLLSLSDLRPEVCGVSGVFREDERTAVEFVFRNREQIEITGARAGDRVCLRYHYLPNRLEKECDEPIFPESLADPSVYVTLAVARVWQSERRMAIAQEWMAEYYRKLRAVRAGIRPAGKRRMPRTLFR